MSAVVADPPVIELRGVEREYPGEPPIRALDGVDLTIENGEMVAIIGPSGSGKSTLINVMGTLDRPTGGTVFIDGIDTRELSERRLCGLRAHRLGFVFQGFHLVESATVAENVADGLVYQGVGRAERRRRATEALELVGLADRAETRNPRSSRAASASAWRSPVRSCRSHRCCSPTNPRATSTAPRVTRSWRCSTS